MDQGTVREFIRPTGDDPTGQWQSGDAYLAGGTFLFSTPLPAYRPDEPGLAQAGDSRSRHRQSPANRPRSGDMTMLESPSAFNVALL